MQSTAARPRAPRQDGRRAALAASVRFRSARIWSLRAPSLPANQSHGLASRAFFKSASTSDQSARRAFCSSSGSLPECDVPGGAFESEDLLDPPGLGFIRPGNQGDPARDGDLDLAARSEREDRSRIPAEQDADPVAKCWRGGSRCSCYGSPGRSCYGSPSGRSTVDGSARSAPPARNSGRAGTDLCGCRTRRSGRTSW